MSMVKAYIARDNLQAHFVRDLLARQGVRAVVLGADLQSAIGGVPAVANALPAVWVHADDKAVAASFIEEMESATQRQKVRPREPGGSPRGGEVIAPQR